MTTNYLASHAPSAASAATALVNGFHVAFYVLLGITLLGVVLTATLLRGTTVAAGGVVEEPGAEPAAAYSDLVGAEAPDDEERAA